MSLGAHSLAAKKRKKRKNKFQKKALIPKEKSSINTDNPSEEQPRETSNWFNGKVAFLVYGAILGTIFSILATDFYQDAQEKYRTAVLISKARNEIFDLQWRLRLCSPYNREDLASRAQRPPEDLKELDHLTKTPILRAIWGLDTSDLISIHCSPSFVSKDLPEILTYSERLQHEWPSSNDSTYNWSARDSDLSRFADNLEKEATLLVNEDLWDEVINSMTPKTKVAIDIWESNRVPINTIGPMLDGPITGILGFMDGILVIQGNQAFYYIDFLRDTAYKRMGNSYYRYQGNIQERNTPKGYLPIENIPEEIQRAATLLSRGMPR